MVKDALSDLVCYNLYLVLKTGGNVGFGVFGDVVLTNP